MPETPDRYQLPEAPVAFESPDSWRSLSNSSLSRFSFRRLVRGGELAKLDRQIEAHATAHARLAADYNELRDAYRSNHGVDTLHQAALAHERLVAGLEDIQKKVTTWIDQREYWTDQRFADGALRARGAQHEKQIKAIKKDHKGILQAIAAGYDRTVPRIDRSQRTGRGAQRRFSTDSLAFNDTEAVRAAEPSVAPERKPMQYPPVGRSSSDSQGPAVNQGSPKSVLAERVLRDSLGPASMMTTKPHASVIPPLPPKRTSGYENSPPAKETLSEPSNPTRKPSRNTFGYDTPLMGTPEGSPALSEVTLVSPTPSELPPLELHSPFGTNEFLGMGKPLADIPFLHPSNASSRYLTGGEPLTPPPTPPRNLSGLRPPAGRSSPEPESRFAPPPPVPQRSRVKRPDRR